LGEFISRDPLGDVDGMSLCRGYFVPGLVGPSGKEKYGGKKTRNCEEQIYSKHTINGRKQKSIGGLNATYVPCLYTQHDLGSYALSECDSTLARSLAYQVRHR